MKEWVDAMKSYKRPISCTEYMARPMRSTFDPILGVPEGAKGSTPTTGASCRGRRTRSTRGTRGRSLTTRSRRVWFHDIFRTDGTPYDVKEVEYIKSVTKK